MAVPSPSPARVLAIAVGVQLDRGLVRLDNEDRISSAPTPYGSVFVLSDGKNAGKRAARFVVDGFVNYLQQPAPRTLAETLRAAHAELPTAAGATVVAAIISGDRASVASAGDSRAYLLRGPRLHLLSGDDASVAGGLSIVDLQLYSGDALLLCSDGLWRSVAHSDMEAIACSAGLSADGASEALLHLALQAGGKDNISLQFIRLGQLPPLSPSPARTWFGMRPWMAAALLTLAVGLLVGGFWMGVENWRRPMVLPHLPSRLPSLPAAPR